MSIDFYLPDYNTAIECQGVRHYLTGANVHFTDDDVKSTQENDVLKYNLCKEHGIPIYHIKYDGNIKESVGDLLKTLCIK